MHFCIDCDVFAHEVVHNCPGCQSLPIEEVGVQQQHPEGGLATGEKEGGDEMMAVAERNGDGIMGTGDEGEDQDGEGMDGII